MRTSTFPGRFESLVKISEFVARSVEAAGFDDPAAYCVLLAVEEACSNIINHGYGGEGKGDIKCSCEVTDDELIITLRDWGETSCPTCVPEPDFDVPLENLKLKGAGLILINKIMDEVHFESAPDNGNVLVMVKRR
jgi:anti-sigma regulatory factor (Ser/Thr protein kinase)